MAVSKSLRHQVMRRDNFRCRYCGATADDAKLTVDHVIPQALGGTDEPSNLATACGDCNTGKSATPPDAALVAEVEEKALEWSRAMTLAAEQRMAEVSARRARTEPFDEAWQQWTVDGQPVPRDANWRNSIVRFLSVGLTDEFFEESVAATMGQSRIPSKDKWRYFCGICWREVTAIQEVAAAGKFQAVGHEEPTWLRADVHVDRERMPQGRGLDPRFDVLHLSETFLSDLLDHLGVWDDRTAHAHRGYWSAMESAYEEFLRLPESLKGVDIEDDPVSEEFSMSVAWYLNKIWEISGFPKRS